MRASLLPIILLASLPLFSQKSAPLATANRLYDELGYHAALKLYESSDPDLTTMRKIANAYRLNHDTQNAEKWYAQVVTTSDEPLDLLHYAQVLQSNGNAGLAKAYFLKYADDQRGVNFANAIDRAAEIQGAGLVEVRNLREVNSEALDFCPVFYQHGIVFASTRMKDGAADPWTGDGFSNLFFAKKMTDGSMSEPHPFSTGGLDARYHEGPVAFSRQGEQVFFTRNEQPGKRKARLGLKIFFARKEADSWSEPTKIDLGDALASDAHPALAPNGRQLFFASDREGGYGGMDLYVSTFSNGHWGIPVNLGPKVNTAGNEVFPHVHDDGTLYFASNGLGGLGGLDIFACAKTPDGNLGEARNLGAPFNSSMDDFGFVLSSDGREGYFSSDRPGGVGKDDIYHFLQPKPAAAPALEVPSATIFVFDQSNGQRIVGASITPLSQHQDGTLVGYDGGEKVTLWPIGHGGNYQVNRQLRDPFAPVVGKFETIPFDSAGQVRLALRADSPRFFLANASGFQSVVYEMDANADDLENWIPLTPTAPAEPMQGRGGNSIPLLAADRNENKLHRVGELSADGVIIELEKIYYDLGSFTIRPDAARELDKLADFMRRRPEVMVELRAHTDASGDDDFNRKLSAQRAQAAAEYIALQGIDRQRITAIGFGEDQLLNHCDDGVECAAADHQRNRRTEVRLYQR